MKRHAPEEPELDAGPLFAAAQARERAELGIGRAASRAERVEPGWRLAALEAVRRFALERQQFLAEDVPVHVPKDADPRAVGAVFQDAKRRGWIAAAGYAPANSSNRAPKVLWRSLIVQAVGTSPAANPKE